VTLDLATLLENRRWLMSYYPFPHVRAHNIFQPFAYREIERSFLKILGFGLREERVAERFSRIFRDYDAYGSRLPHDKEDPLWIFASREWHDLLAGLFRLRTTGDINVELHHHTLGSSHGRIHNDFNPGWFLGEASLSGVNLSDGDICSYKFGTLRCATPLQPHRRIRALAMIFYLANKNWKQGDGGETGLYEFGDADVASPDVAIAPTCNSLLAFEVTPHSFHAFLKNKRSVRNAVVLWLHRDYKEAATQWGEAAIVEWPGK
jgi:hypothetical protein